MGVVFAPMPLADGHRALQGASSIRRLLALDDLWTATLGGAVRDEDRAALAEIGEEMVGLLADVQESVTSYRSIVQGVQEELDRATDRALDAADAAVGSAVTASVRDLMLARPWAATIDDAFGTLQDSRAELDTLQAKLNLVRSGHIVPGDLSRRIRRAGHIAAFVLTAVAFVIPPVAPVIILTSAAIQLALELDEP